PTYTAATFSSKRYEHWAFQSQYHNVPTINGVMQGAGRGFAARQVTCRADDAAAEIAMDIAPAYPASARVASWIRKVTLFRDRFVEIQDRYRLSDLAGKTALHFLAAAPLDAAREPGRIFFPADAGVRMEYDAASLIPSVETLPMTDKRLASVWGPALYRLSLTPKTPALENTIVVRIVPASAGR
ncbi:MAG: heparinase II/III family protein, partial [Verrucomicrobia bacterium]|nr:heparinase II/III family protein [Verrucomicrobiota bacterium]